MTQTAEYMREAKRKWRATNGHEGLVDYWLKGGRDKKAQYWAENKDAINARRRAKRAAIKQKRDAQGNGDSGRVQAGVRGTAGDVCAGERDREGATA